MKKKDEGKTGKNRRRREKAKLRKGGKVEASATISGGSRVGVGADNGDEMGSDDGMAGVETAASAEDAGIIIHEDD